MKYILLITMTCALLLSGCTEEDGPSCEPITDTYVSTFSKDDSRTSDCPAVASSEPGNIELFAKEDDNVDVVLEGIPGRCSGQVNGCSLLASCVLTVQGEAAGEFSLDVDIDSEGFSGKARATIYRGKAPKIPDGCSNYYLVQGVRQ